MFDVPWVASGGSIAHRELRRRCLTQDDGSSPTQSCHAGRVEGRYEITVERRTRMSRQSGRIDDVLDANRNAVQRSTQPACRKFLVEHIGLLARALVVHRLPGQDLSV